MSLDQQFRERSSSFLWSESNVLTLGMPHLAPAGLSLEWLLRECCHRHWQALSSSLGMKVAELSDMCGERAVPSVVAATIKGATHHFGEDHAVQILSEVVPRRETGWLSAWLIRSSAGAACRVELVTHFVKRCGPSNKDLRSAEVPHEWLPYIQGSEAKSALRLAEVGRQELAEAPASGVALLSYPVLQRQMNALGFLCSASLIEPIQQTERRAIPGSIDAYLPISRELHIFDSVDPGDALEFDCVPKVLDVGPNASILLRSVARRKSDDRLVALSVSRHCTETRGRSS